jgi:polysaccharide biosynthesis transport protein
MTADDPMIRTFDGVASRVDAAALRSIGFTSALFGEGVSTIALGTALSIAALRRDAALLVDANWIQPSLTLDAHLESAPGLAEYLAKKADLDRIIRPATRSRLAFLPVGDRALARPTLRTVTSFLAEDLSSFQTVIVDLPPLLAGEPFVLPWAALLDQIFVVIREAATPLPVLRRALAKAGLGAPQIVLNRAMPPSVERSALLVASRS